MTKGRYITCSALAFLFIILQPLNEKCKSIFEKIHAQTEKLFCSISIRAGPRRRPPPPECILGLSSVPATPVFPRFSARNGTRCAWGSPFSGGLRRDAGSFAVESGCGFWYLHYILLTDKRV